jgi:hypothetical protein
MQTNSYGYFDGEKYYIGKRQNIQECDPKKKGIKFKSTDERVLYDLEFLSSPLTDDKKPSELNDSIVGYEARVTLSKTDYRKRVRFVPFILEDGTKIYEDRRLHSLPSGKQDFVDRLSGYDSPAFRRFFGFCDEIIKGLASNQSFYTTEAYLAEYYSDIMAYKNTEFLRSKGDVDIYRFTKNKKPMIVTYDAKKNCICIQESNRGQGVNDTYPIHIDDITIISRDKIRKLVEKLQQLKEEASSSR